MPVDVHVQQTACRDFLASFLFLAIVYSLPICLGLSALALNLRVSCLLRSSQLSFMQLRRSVFLRDEQAMPVISWSVGQVLCWERYHSGCSCQAGDVLGTIALWLHHKRL